jgi:hypothetical protein
MAHITSIGAGLYSDLSVAIDTAEIAAAFAAPTESNLKAAFAVALNNGATPSATAGEFIRIRNVREFPAMGTPPNVVNVAVYGQKSSQQIQGQSDAPSIEITLNYIGADWQNTANYLGKMVGDGTRRLFRFTLLNSEPSGGYASTVSGVGTAENSQYFWFGKMEALLVTPQLTDANTATLTITVQSDFYGAFTS